MKGTSNSQVKERNTTGTASGARALASRGVTTTVELITPEVAAQMLERNTSNRPLSRSTVARYADDMKAGRWEYNGQDILFSEDGELLDGQHRLVSIGVAGVPVLMGVKRGLPKTVFTTLDAGKARTAGDVLALMGYARYNAVAAAGRLALAFIEGANLRGGGATTLTRREVTDFVVAHPYLIDAAKIAGVLSGRLNTAPVAAVIFLANDRRFFDDQIAEFIDGVASGEGLERGDPRLTLREWAVNERLRNRGIMPTHACFSATARAWSAFARNEDLKQIKVSRNASRETLEIVGFHPS
jgi:hypothetical protein